MSSVVQARLDPDTQAALGRLVKRLGTSPSEVVRRGIRLLEATTPGHRRPRIVGIGMSDSGIPDLGSNKKHMEGFGR